MHGLIHLELQKFVEERFGAKAWAELIRRAGVASEIYTPLRSYPDEQMLALVGEAVTMTGFTVTRLLEEFGEALVPTYLSLYGNLIKPDWRTLEVIEHTEETIHRVVRMRTEGAKPPRLRAERTRPNEVVLTYDSPRKLCAVARGIVKGVAKQFKEVVTIDEKKCMHKGDPACVIVFRKEA
jgi:predicted hydrocarbon binding protein